MAGEKEFSEIDIQNMLRWIAGLLPVGESLVIEGGDDKVVIGRDIMRTQEAAPVIFKAKHSSPFVKSKLRTEGAATQPLAVDKKGTTGILRESKAILGAPFDEELPPTNRCPNCQRPVVTYNVNQKGLRPLWVTSACPCGHPGGVPTPPEHPLQKMVPDGYEIVDKGKMNNATTMHGDLVWNKDKKNWEPVDCVNEYVEIYIAVIRLKPVAK